MECTYERVEACYESIKQRIPFQPKAAIILGSGLGNYAEQIEVVETINYADIKEFPVSMVSGHRGRFVFGYVNTLPLVIMQGRVHYYEGYSMAEVVLPVRLMKKMGAEVLILTNAAGSVNETYAPGDFMMIQDQITSFVPSPFIGSVWAETGVRFSDMTSVYNLELRKLIKETAAELGIDMHEGVYLQLTGPEFETPAIIRMCRTLGADAVGMSTACEASAANALNMDVCGISCISNKGAGMSDQKLSNEEVYEVTEKISKEFEQLITGILGKIETMKS